MSKLLQTLCALCIFAYVEVVYGFQCYQCVYVDNPKDPRIHEEALPIHDSCKLGLPPAENLTAECTSEAGEEFLMDILKITEATTGRNMPFKTSLSSFLPKDMIWGCATVAASLNNSKQLSIRGCLPFSGIDYCGDLPLQSLAIGDGAIALLIRLLFSDKVPDALISYCFCSGEKCNTDPPELPVSISTTQGVACKTQVISYTTIGVCLLISIAERIRKMSCN